MESQSYIVKMAERYKKGDSPAMLKILERAMSEEEAQFLLDLPAPNEELAAKYSLGEAELEAKLQGLAQRGLVISSRKGMRCPGDLATLHDAILASAPQYIPEGLSEAWMELYDGEGWANEIGEALAGFGVVALRTVPALGSLPEGTELAAFEDIAAIIEANKDLITVRNCCCRTGAGKCDHPREVCIQFGRRAQYDLYRQSGRQVSAEEAMALAEQACRSGLVPTVTNMSMMQALEFICFCCGCCCLIIDPARRVGSVDKILAPSRFLAEIDDEACWGCEACTDRCCVDAIEIQEYAAARKARIDEARCLGCGACVAVCPEDDGIRMKLLRPLDFIPETFAGPTSILHM